MDQPGRPEDSRAAVLGAWVAVLTRAGLLDPVVRILDEGDRISEPEAGPEADS